MVKKGLLVLAMLVVTARVHSAGLPGEYLISGKWRAVGNESSPLSNPAFVLERSWLRARFTGSSLSGDYTMGDLGLSVPITLHQTLAFSYLYQSAGEYDRTTFDGSTQTSQSVGSMEDRNNVFTLTYAVSPWRLLGIGANVNIVNSRFESESETGVGIDAGLTLRLPPQRVLGRHVLGVAMQNIVAPEIGTAFARTLNFAWSGAYAERYVSSLVSFQLRDLGAASSEGAAGSEWALDTKLGVWPFKIASIYGLLGFAETGYDYWGTAVGVNLPVANNGRDLEACYQYVGLRDGLTMHSIYVQGEFGWNREEMHARLEERRKSALPRQLFQRALEMYDQGKYWEAYFAFTRIKADYPRFNRLDAADYYSARCLEALDMRQAALTAYELSRKTYPGSRFVPEVHLGLARLAYREGAVEQLERVYRELAEEPGADSVHQHARYLLGEALMKAGQHAKARVLLDSIPQTHPEYTFAQYSAAHADLALGWPREMERRLLTVAVAPQVTAVQREIVARANLKLGLLYLEDLQNDAQALPKAVTALRRVPATSAAYSQALSALAWSALKVRNWPDCVTAGRALLAFRQADARLRAEGALVAGYALFSTRDYIAALDVLESGAELLDKAREDVARSSSGARATYDQIAKSTVHLAFQKESSERLDAVTELRRRQTAVKQELDKMIVESDVAATGKALAQRQDDLRTDLLFVLAEATKKAASERAEEYRLRLQKKTIQYDQQIQQLKDKMEQIE